MSGIVGGNLGRGSGLIKAGAVDDNSVTLAKMAGLARGKLIYGDTSGDPAALAVGGADEVLTHDGTDFDWAAVADIAWQSVQTSTVTAVAGKGYPVNTISGAITMNLPAGVVGEQVAVVDYAGTFDVNALTVSANGSEKIKGHVTDFTMNTERQAAVLTYVDSIQGWVVTSSAPDPGVTQAAYITATGPDGASGSTDGDYKYHVFNDTKTGSNGFSVTNVGNAAGDNSGVEYLVIAGGGGSAGYRGGGGAGGYRTAAGHAVTRQNYNITVGAGGASDTDGSDAVFSSITSDGGGACIGTHGTAGGSGSGAGSSDQSGQGGAGTAGQGNDGGNGDNTAPGFATGGGGGAGAVGGNASAQTGGNGGNGSASSISGSSVTRAGGGGGGSRGSGDTPGSGGSGGGGAGTVGSGTATSGTANTGGGGGSGGAGTGGSGGKGVVIIRYKFQN